MVEFTVLGDQFTVMSLGETVNRELITVNKRLKVVKKLLVLPAQLHYGQLYYQGFQTFRVV
jgi:hypothetical protein